MRDASLSLCPHLVAGGHHGHHRELLHLHLGHAHRGQQPDFGGAHVGALGQDALAAFDVMSDGPAQDRGTPSGSGRGKERVQVIGDRRQAGTVGIENGTTPT